MEPSFAVRQTLIIKYRTVFYIFEEKFIMRYTSSVEFYRIYNLDFCRAFTEFFNGSSSPFRALASYSVP
jgi:hypothetical protein